MHSHWSANSNQGWTSCCIIYNTTASLLSLDELPYSLVSSDVLPTFYPCALNTVKPLQKFHQFEVFVMSLPLGLPIFLLYVVSLLSPSSSGWSSRLFLTVSVSTLPRAAISSVNFNCIQFQFYFQHNHFFVSPLYFYLCCHVPFIIIIFLNFMWETRWQHSNMLSVCKLGSSHRDPSPQTLKEVKWWAADPDEQL